MNQNNISSNGDKSLPFYMRLYPPLEELKSQDEEQEKILKLDDFEEDSKEEGENKNNENKKELNELNLTKEFLEELLKKPNSTHKAKIYEILSNALKHSKLIEKMEDEKNNTKNLNQDDLSLACAKKFFFTKFNRGDIIFRIGDDGDIFYYVLKGRANILKIREIPNILMSIIEYINYCIFLIKSGEKFLFQEVIRINYNVFKVSSDEEIFILFRIWFKSSLISQINQHLIDKNKSLEDYFGSHEQDMKDYNFDIRELEILEIDKNNGVPLSYIKWRNYILKKCELTTNELVFFEQFHKILFNGQKKKISCLVYESLLYLEPSTYFGDSALDSETKKRNATIRAEEDIYLACLRSVDYLNIIAPKRRFEKTKIIAFLFNTFFFEQINPHIFERNYFHLFYSKEYPKNTVLFDYGTIPKNLYLIKEGQISLDLKISVLEIHNLIKFLYNNIINNHFFKNLSNNKKNEILPQQALTEINKYIRDKKLDRIKMQNYRFVQEMNRVQNFRITILMGVDALGLEEIFLRIPYLMKGVVVKNLICYEIAVDKIFLMLKDEKQIVYTYTKKSVTKILTLMERLQSIKKNCVDMAYNKYNVKNDSFFDDPIASTQLPLLKNNNSSGNINLYNQINKNKDNYRKKLATNDNINYREDINILMEKANSIMQKCSIKEKEGETTIDNNKTKNNEKEPKEEKKDSLKHKKRNKHNKVIDDDDNKISSYKTVQLINMQKSKNDNIALFKTPIKNFVIKNVPEYKNNLFSKIKNGKIKGLNIVPYNIKNRRKNVKSLQNKATNEEIDNSNEKEENSDKLKPKLYTGIKTKNIFLLGDNKYYTINKLKKQIKDFNSMDRKGTRLEIIQSNEINNNYNEEMFAQMDKNDPKYKYEIKKKLIRFIQNFNHYHLSFVPISIKYNEQLVNSNNNEQNMNSSGNFSKLTRNSSYSEKLFVNKTLKNYYIMNKRNKINRDQLKRANSELYDYNKGLPKIKNTFIKINRFNRIHNNTDKN